MAVILAETANFDSVEPAKMAALIAKNTAFMTEIIALKFAHLYNYVKSINIFVLA